MFKLVWTFFLLTAIVGWSFISSCSKKSTDAEGPTRPATPTNLVGSAIDMESISLSWQDNADNEDGFRVYSWDGVQWGAIGTIPTDSTYYIIAGLWPGTEYSYKVKAFNSAGESDFSGSVTVRTYFSIPTAPQNVTATAISYEHVRVTWSDVSDDEIGFAVQRRTAVDTFSTIATTAPDDTIYDDENLIPETLYYYRVGAAGWDTTGWSEVDTTLTMVDLVSGAPSDLEAQVIMGTGIRLSWQDNSNNESFFIINRNEEDIGYIRLDSVHANITTYLDPNVHANWSYKYTVQASLSAGYTVESNEASAYYAYTSAGAIPLALGNNWDYNVQYPMGETYDIHVNVIRVDLFEDVPWFLTEEENEYTEESDTTYLRNEVGGDSSGVFYREQGSSEAELLWKYPTVKEDYFFVEGDCVLVFSAVEDVVVPAGEFHGCIGYRRYAAGRTSIETLIKPGLGIVRVYTSSGDFYILQQLDSYRIFGP